MNSDSEIEVLLDLDGFSYEVANGYLVEFMVRRTDVTAEHPQGIRYALVFRRVGGESIVRFDNAHAVKRVGGGYAKAVSAYDHWHKSEKDRGRPYKFTTAMQLLSDFQKAVERVMQQRKIAP